MRAYLELEAQPAPKMVYTARLDKARTKRMLKLRSVIGCGRGIGVHRVRAKVRASVGARRNKIGEEVEGRTGSFINNLRPSAIGWRRP